MRISPKLKKFLFRTVIVLTTLSLAAYLFLFLYYPYARYGHTQLMTWTSLDWLVTATLRIPYADWLDKALVKESLEDLEEITYDEWMSMECECRDPKYDIIFNDYDLVVLPPKVKAESRKLTPQQKKLNYCIRPDHWQAYGTKGFINKMPKGLFGNNLFTERGLHLTMNEYILKYPKVLNNVIKILEKPCFYFKDSPLPVDSEIFPHSSLSWVEHSIKQERKALYCDQDKLSYYEKERTYSVLTIIDNTGRAKIALVIPRKDTAHLLENK